MSTHCITNVTGSLRARSHHKHSPEKNGPCTWAVTNLRNGPQTANSNTHPLTPSVSNLARQPRQGSELTNHVAQKQDLHIFCQG